MRFFWVKNLATLPFVPVVVLDLEASPAEGSEPGGRVLKALIDLLGVAPIENADEDGHDWAGGRQKGGAWSGKPWKDAR